MIATLVLFVADYMRCERVTKYEEKKRRAKFVWVNEKKRRKQTDAITHYSRYFSLQTCNACPSNRRKQKLLATLRIWIPEDFRMDLPWVGTGQFFEVRTRRPPGANSGWL